MCSRTPRSAASSITSICASEIRTGQRHFDRLKGDYVCDRNKVIQPLLQCVSEVAPGLDVRAAFTARRAPLYTDQFLGVAQALGSSPVRLSLCIPSSVLPAALP